jgi:hypothetical protein
MVCLRNICINTLLKGAKNDNDNNNIINNNNNNNKLQMGCRPVAVVLIRMNMR